MIDNKQTNLTIGDDESKEKMRGLDLPEVNDDNYFPLETRKKSDKPENPTKVEVQNHVLVTGSIEENTFKITVVSEYVFDCPKDTPAVDMLDNEVSVWRNQLLGFIERNSEMLRKAFWVLTR